MTPFKRFAFLLPPSFLFFYLFSSFHFSLILHVSFVFISALLLLVFLHCMCVVQVFLVTLSSFCDVIQKDFKHVPPLFLPHSLSLSLSMSLSLSLSLRFRVTCLLWWSQCFLTTSGLWLLPLPLSKASSSHQACPTSQVYTHPHTHKKKSPKID